MPALAPLLAHAGVLGAADRRNGVVARHTDVAADAFADVVEPAFFDLSRQEGICNGRACRTDDVDHAAAQLRDHGVGRGETTDADHGLAGGLLDEIDEGFLGAFAAEARGQRVVVPGRYIHVPQVGQLGQHRHDVARLGQLDAAGAEHFFGGETQGDAAAVADGVAGVLEQFAQQPHAVFQRTAIFVGALVAAALQEVHGQRQVVGGVHVHDVHARLHAAHGRFAVPAAVVADVGLVHGPRLVRVAVFGRLVRGRQQHFAREQVRGRRAVVGELHRRQRAVGVHLFAHQRQRRDVAVIPEPRFDIGREVGAGVDFAFFGGHHGPAALGLHLAHGGVRQRHGVTHAIAVRHLEKTVLRGHRADADRFEQRVVAGVAHQAGSSAA